MKFSIISALLLAAALPAQAKVRTVVECADEYTAVRIDRSGEFGSSEYDVLLKDLRNGDKFPYRATLKDGSFISKEKGNPTINTSPTSISFVKGGWGLVVIEGENCNIDLE
jgi:hypothetical protein